MRSGLDAQTYRQIYERLDKVSPVPSDCGLLCGSACCLISAPEEKGTEEELGMYLLPGEDAIHDKEDPWLSWQADNAADYDFPASFQGIVWFVSCAGAKHCNRSMRPIQCRTFPLAPHLTRMGKLVMILHTDPLPYACPLITERMKLNEDFVRETYEVWKILIGDKRIRDLVRKDSRARRKEGRHPLQIWPPA